jgi:hypothetical protein
MKFNNFNAPLIFFVLKFLKNAISKTCQQRVGLHNSASNATKLYGSFFTYFKIFILFRRFVKFLKATISSVMSAPCQSVRP